MPLFALLIYWDEQSGQSGPPEALQKVYSECAAHNAKVQHDGVLADGNPLMPTATAKTVQLRDGATLVTDGPFVETKEQLGGYYLLDCRDREEAIRYAGDILDAQSNRAGGVELHELA